MKVINLTPHAVTILGSEGELIMEVQSSGNARAKQESSPIGLLDNIPLFETHYGAPIDLPDPEEGTILIVSKITADAAKQVGRSLDDLYLVFDTVRDPSNPSNILGCRGLAPYDIYKPSEAGSRRKLITSSC